MKYIIAAYTDEGFYGYVCLMSDHKNEINVDSIYEFTDEKDEATVFNFDSAYQNLDRFLEIYYDFQYLIIKVE